jgi:SAM-dependent methyltransferase
MTFEVPLSHLTPSEKAKRAGSFGGAAKQYERYRPGPPMAAIDWILPEHVNRVVDLGAGTGAMTRLLVDRADEVLAVEPDDRMRAVLVEEVPGVEVVAGRGESLPISDGYVDAVLASSSWHWMDLVPTLREVGRVLVPEGILGALWSGPDPEGPLLIQAQALLAARSEDDTESSAGEEAGARSELAGFIMGDAVRPQSTLEIPRGDVPFHQPEHEVFMWNAPMTADELVGLLSTLSWIITIHDEQRDRVLSEARRLLGELLGVEGDVAVDKAFRCDAWRARRFD